MPLSAPSRVLEYPALSPAQAAAHLAKKLGLEVDPSDVWTDLQAKVPGFILLDGRGAASYARGHVPGAIHLWHREISAATTKHLDKKKVIVTQCTGVGCNASTKAAYKLAKLGFLVKEMTGGLAWWKLEGYPVRRGTKP
ncbi:MAG TPA: rhodanese-like domain-containing protein [bacterium]|nr:rhodanese-like domain-containing protein [bacterium]